MNKKNIIPNFTEAKNQKEIEMLFFDSIAIISKNINNYRDNVCMQHNINEKNCLFSQGSTLYRGYFCPNPIEDIVIGNAKRGKLTSRIINSGISHKYQFNKQGEIERVFQYLNGKLTAFEDIICSDSIDYGYFWDCELLTVFSECIYNDNSNIVLFSKCNLSPFNYDVMEIEQTQFIYTNDKLSNCISIHIFVSLLKKITYSKIEYSFFIQNNKCIEYMCNNKNYQCKINRNITDFARKPKIRGRFCD